MFSPYKWYKIYVHVFFKPRLILTWEYIFVKIVPFAYFVHRGRSKPRLIFSRIKALILHDEKNISPSSTWSVPVRYFLARSWAVRLGGRWELPSSSKKKRAFSQQTYPWVSFYQFSMKETTFCRKTYNFAYFSQISSLREGNCAISVVCI